MPTYINPNILSIIAVSISAFTFLISIIINVIKYFKNKPKLIFFISRKIINNKSDNKKFEMMNVIVSNVGFTPIILKRFVAIGNNGAFSQMGIGDEPARAYGILEQKFPFLLEPGKSLEFSPKPISAIISNYECPCDPKKRYDPWSFFALIDSCNKVHLLDASDVRKELNIEKNKPHQCKISYLLSKKRAKKLIIKNLK